jgi:glycosyltransferase involved in cell wall biosynthesis
MNWFQNRFIISEPDRTYLQSFGLGRLNLLQNGVDLEKFKRSAPIPQKFDIAFVGNMGYYPNVQAAKYLVKKLAGKIKENYPALKILIAGANPSRSVLALSNEWIKVSGFMEDIREAYQSAKVFVAPIFTGSGLQNKILEAMAMELPCITTSVVNESIKAPKHLIGIADDVDSFVTQILYHLQNPEEAMHIGKSGRAFVADHFSWQQCCEPLDKLGEDKFVKS